MITYYLLLISYMVYIEDLNAKAEKINPKDLIIGMTAAQSNLWSLTNLGLCPWIYVHRNICIWGNNCFYTYHKFFLRLMRWFLILPKKV